jgi:hypothetical protein
MGTFLATSLLAVPIITWMTGTLFFKASQLQLARIPLAPRGIFPIFRELQFFSSRRAAEFPSRRDALGEVNR